jgi:hypothetical protein
MTIWTEEQYRRLAEPLSECDCLETVIKRTRVIREVEHKLRAGPLRVEENSIAIDHVVEIVAKCADREGGIDALLEIVRLREGAGSLRVDRIEGVWRAIRKELEGGPGGPGRGPSAAGYPANLKYYAVDRGPQREQLKQALMSSGRGGPNRPLFCLVQGLDHDCPDMFATGLRSGGSDGLEHILRSLKLPGAVQWAPNLAWPPDYADADDLGDQLWASLIGPEMAEKDAVGRVAALMVMADWVLVEINFLAESPRLVERWLRDCLTFLGALPNFPEGKRLVVFVYLKYRSWLGAGPFESLARRLTNRNVRRSIARLGGASAPGGVAVHAPIELKGVPQSDVDAWVRRQCSDCLNLITRVDDFYRQSRIPVELDGGCVAYLKPEVEQGRRLIPMRYVAEALGRLFSGCACRGA